MSANRAKELAKELGTPGGLVLLAVSILLARFVPGNEPQYNGVTFQALVTAVDRLDGTVTSLSNTVMTTFAKVTEEIRDGQRRMDRLELNQSSNKSLIESQGRMIEDLKTQVQDIKIKIAKDHPS